MEGRGMIVCVFDTETTGLIDNHIKPLVRQPEVIEFACVWADWDDLTKVVASYETLIRPQHSRLADKPIEEKPHNLTDEDLKDCVTFDQVADKIQSLLTGVEIVSGHNLSFDMEMMDIEYERLRRRLAWPSARMCTVEQTMHINGNRMALGRNKRGEIGLYEYLTGEEHKDAHRAMSDVMATLRCLQKIREKGWL
jgi:DNA polymerase III epsilon subunit-like protein